MPHTEGIDKAGSCAVYDLELEGNLSELIGRLIIDWVRAVGLGFSAPIVKTKVS
jgi:hypothetical protein